MSLLFLPLLSYLVCINSLDVFVSMFHVLKCKIDQDGCIGQISRPFAEISDALIYIRSVSSKDRNLITFTSVNVFLKSNNKTLPYLITGESYDPFTYLPGKIVSDF